MLEFVYSDSWIFTVFWWELISILSFFMINHKDATEALIVNLFGGSLLLLCEIPYLRGPCIAIAIIIKSAQFPFHNWIHKASVAPNYLSAFLHSSTLVQSGLILLCKTSLIDNTADLIFQITSIATMVYLTFFKTQDSPKSLAISTTQLALSTALLHYSVYHESVVNWINLHILYKPAIFLGLSNPYWSSIALANCAYSITHYSYALPLCAMTFRLIRALQSDVKFPSSPFPFLFTPFAGIYALSFAFVFFSANTVCAAFFGLATNRSELIFIALSYLISRIPRISLAELHFQLPKISTFSLPVISLFSIPPWLYFSLCYLCTIGLGFFDAPDALATQIAVDATVILLVIQNFFKDHPIQLNNVLLSCGLTCALYSFFQTTQIAPVYLPVNTIVANKRALDTLGEVSVFLLAGSLLREPFLRFDRDSLNSYWAIKPYKNLLWVTGVGFLLRGECYGAYMIPVISSLNISGNFFHALAMLPMFFFPGNSGGFAAGILLGIHSGLSDTSPFPYGILLIALFGLFTQWHPFGAHSWYGSEWFFELFISLVVSWTTRRLISSKCG